MVPPPPLDLLGIPAAAEENYSHDLVELGSICNVGQLHQTPDTVGLKSSLFKTFLGGNKENKTYMMVFTVDRFDFGLSTACCYCIIFGNFP